MDIQVASLNGSMSLWNIYRDVAYIRMVNCMYNILCMEHLGSPGPWEATLS